MLSGGLCYGGVSGSGGCVNLQNLIHPHNKVHQTALRTQKQAKQHANKQQQIQYQDSVHRINKAAILNLDLTYMIKL
jgi:hypothetical protein